MEQMIRMDKQDTDALEGLAERVEALTEPDTHIDALIWCALAGKRYAEHWESAFGNEGTRVAFTEPPKRTRIVSRTSVPNVTASLDSAMTLVPEGLMFTVSRQDSNSAASIYRRNEEGVRQTCCPLCVATTPALALTAACLRARAQDGGA